MKRPGHHRVLWFLGGLALGTMLAIIPLTAKSIDGDNALSDRLATAEFMISIFIAVVLVHLMRRSGSGR
jgi:hypothetical protein